MKWTAYTPLTWTSLTHARIVTWVGHATNSSVSLESTAAKLGTRTCRPLQTKFLQLYSFTFSEVSLDSAAILGTMDMSSIRNKVFTTLFVHMQWSVITSAIYFQSIRIGITPKPIVLVFMRTELPLYVSRDLASTQSFRTQIKWSASIHFSVSTPNNNCVLLPVTVLQYITSINYYRLKLRKVLHAQHRAPSTYICIQVQYFTVHNINNLISVESFLLQNKLYKTSALFAFIIVCAFVYPAYNHYIDLAATVWMLIIIPYADVLGLYAIQHKTVLCYIQTLPSQDPSEDELEICKLPDIILCYIHNM
jgi:hypothetical protein